jgi:nitrile hydratase accessory protein
LSQSDPAFDEPWQARAFALTMKLSQRGHFSQREWTKALARELKEVANRGEVDDGSHYYEHWLAALEALVVEKGLTDMMALAARKEDWREAYRRTPHGKPVELAQPPLTDRRDPLSPTNAFRLDK